MTYKLAVVAFPGNNSENETARAAQRNGFDADIVRWNEIDRIGNYDVYILPGGFSYEDRGRAGFIASQEPIFAKIREEAAKGRLILGICNGAQMVLEAGLIPIEENPFPLALAKNIRTAESGEILGEGFINEWSYITSGNKDTAFTNQSTKPLYIPFAHAEGRFTSVDKAVLNTLEEDTYVAFRYSDEAGNVSSFAPICPNGAASGVAAVVNKEGTIMAVMPHPERFWKNCDGDSIFTSMINWLENNQPSSVVLGDIEKREAPSLQKFTPKPNKQYIAKKLIITDNEAFSLSQVARATSSEEGSLSQVKIFEIESDLSEEVIVETGVLCNLNKEYLVPNWSDLNGIIVEEFKSAEDVELMHRMKEHTGQDMDLKSYTLWIPEGFSDSAQERFLSRALYANPHSARLWTN